MKRRSFFSHTAAVASITAVSACRSTAPTATTTAANLAQPAVRWRMATSWPKSLDIVFGAAERICQQVSNMTDGRFVITPFAADELAPGLEVLSAVQTGTADCGHTAGYYYVKQNPALAFGTTVPFGLNAQQQNAWLYNGGGLETMQRLYADFGVINFPAGSTGAQMGGWFKQKVGAIADLKGLKMRIPGLGGRVMQQLGVETQVLAGHQIFEAMAQDTLDAAEWVGPYEDEKLGLNRIASLYYYPGWWEPGTTYEIQVNLAQWQKLPQEYQEIFRTAVIEAHTTMLAHYDGANGTALQRLLLGGTQLQAYSPDILQAAQTAAFELYENDASQDATFREVYLQWKAFRSQVYQWNRVNELSFSSFATQQINSLDPLN